MKTPLMSRTVTMDNTELCFDVSQDELHRLWLKTKGELEDAGWRISDDGRSANIAHDCGEFSDVKVRLVGSSNDHEHSRSVRPDGFEILTKMGAGALETALVESIAADVEVERVVVGLNWTLVRAGAYCGIARSPARGVDGARTVRPEGGFKGMALRELAAYLKSTDPLSRSLGLAAVNCFWNRPDADYPELKAMGGFSGLSPPGDGVVIIGGFRAALRRLPAAVIVEREPKEGDIPADQAADVISGAKILAITAQTLMNCTLVQILAGAGSQTKRILIGPSAPLCPLLLNHGIDEISAAVVHDADAAEAFICETGSMIMMDHIASSKYLA